MKLPACLVLLLVAALPSCQKSGETKWVNPASLHPGPRQPRPLSEAQVSRIRAVQASLAEVDPSPAESWPDDFQRDHDPEREIAIYEAIATAYRAFCAARPRTLDEKNDAYRLLLVRSGASVEDTLSHAPPKVLTRAEAVALLELYAAPAAPILISK